MLGGPDFESESATGWAFNVGVSDDEGLVVNGEGDDVSASAKGLA